MQDVATQVEFHATASDVGGHLNDYEQTKQKLSGFLGAVGNATGEGPDDEAPISRLQYVESIKRQTLDVLCDVDTMRDGMTTHLKVMTEILRLLDSDETTSAAFALPLVEEAAGRVKAAIMHWAAGVCSLQVARNGMTRSLMAQDGAEV